MTRQRPVQPAAPSDEVFGAVGSVAPLPGATLAFGSRADSRSGAHPTQLTNASQPNPANGQAGSAVEARKVALDSTAVSAVEFDLPDRNLFLDPINHLASTIKRLPAMR